MSIDLFCIIALLIFFFGLAFGINDTTNYPRQVPEPWHVHSKIQLEEE